MRKRLKLKALTKKLISRLRKRSREGDLLSRDSWNRDSQSLSHTYPFELFLTHI
jgi:hypothetical protein